jgi:site-specific DNA-methyltransferase (adenine-specific)
VSRVERIGNATLHLADCDDVHLPLDAAIVSDPPYGIAHLQGGSRSGGAWERRSDWRVIGDDKPFYPARWLFWPEVILWGANHYSDKLPASPCWIAWDKKLGAKIDDFSDGELAWSKTGRRFYIHRQLWNGLLAHEPSERRWHISQKPVALMRFCIGLVKHQTIIDPYMGSGSTGVAAVQMGRPFIGIEIDETHFSTACRRIEQAYRQADLFVPSPAPKPEQMALVP